MNFLGKILVVLIFVMSLMFMAFAIAVWAVNRNYYDAINNPSTGYKVQKNKLQSELDGLRAQFDSLRSDLGRERATKRLALAALENERLQLVQELDGLNRAQDQQAQATREAVAAMQSMQDNLKSWREEIDGLRTRLHTAIDERNESFARVIDLTDQMQQATATLATLKKNNEALLAQANQMRNVLRERGLNEQVPAEIKVDGIIQDVQDNRYVAVNIGRDDGLQIGDSLEVYSGAQYLGRVRVVLAEPDRAVCEIQKSLQKGPIKVGDNVTTKI